MDLRKGRSDSSGRNERHARVGLSEAHCLGRTPRHRSRRRCLARHRRAGPPEGPREVGSQGSGYEPSLRCPVVRGKRASVCWLVELQGSPSAKKERKKRAPLGNWDPLWLPCQESRVCFDPCFYTTTDNSLNLSIGKMTKPNGEGLCNLLSPNRSSCCMLPCGHGYPG